MYLAKYSRLTLPTASILHDIVYNLSWFIMLAWLGVKMTPIQMTGIMLVTLGIALMSYNTPVP